VWWYSAAFGAPSEGVFAVGWWIGLLGYLWFAAAGIALAAIDIELKRLPDAIVLPSLAVVGIMLLGSAALTGDWERILTVLIGGVALFAFFFLMVLVYPAGMGLGDVKLAPLIGIAMGFVGWPAVAVGTFAGFLVGAVVGLAAIAVNSRARVEGRKHAIPFGPWMLVGSWVGIVWGGSIMHVYLRLTGLT
jgi:leader peptidase (prepilin peptidase)/N-methyltransferase